MENSQRFVASPTGNPAPVFQASVLPGVTLAGLVRSIGRFSMKVLLLSGLILSQAALAQSLEEPACKNRFDSDVVVVGAGGGGLSAAAALARAGKKVIVLEQHHKVGGYMTNFERRGYTFEVSLHGFDGLNEGGINRKLFEKLGILDRVTPVQHEVIYRAAYPDETLLVPKDIEDYKRLLLTRFPKEKASIEKFFATVDKLDSLYGKLAGPMLGEGSQMPSVPDLLAMKRYSDMRLTDFLTKELAIRDPRLIHALTQLSAFLGTVPQQQSTMLFLTMWNAYHRHGFYNFLGGSQALSNAMADVIQEAGGLIHTKQLVTGIEVENGSAKLVRTKKGNCYAADFVISNASLPGTIKLIGEDKLSSGERNRYQKWKAGPSMVSVYLGVDQDYRAAFGETSEIFVNTNDNPSEADEVANRCRYDGPYSIVNYTMVDPSYVPSPDKNVIVLSVLANYDCFASLEDYKAHKEQLARDLIVRAEAVLPGLASHVEVMEVGTPKTMERYTLNPRGSIVGFDHNIEQVMFKRMNTTYFEGIDNLYLVGAWTFPGGGQSAVMISGMQAAQDILKREQGQLGGPIMRFLKRIVAFFGSL